MCNQLGTVTWQSNPVHYCSISLYGFIDEQRITVWLGDLLWEKDGKPHDIYRIKGVLCVQGKENRVILQGT